jgi:peptidoglycan/LPS O-acetylase OafA/YrhL
LGLIVAGVVLVAKLYFSGKFSAWNRWYVWGSAAGLMVSAAVLYRGELTGWVKKVLCVLGDSSYAIYLIHPLVLYHAQNIAGTQHNYGDEWPIRTWTAVALMMAVSILLAITAHYMFERPVSRWLSAGLARVLPSPTSKPA